MVANLSISLSELGKKVGVLDADFGLANIDVLLGLTPHYHSRHVLFGNKTLSEIMVQDRKDPDNPPPARVCSMSNWTLAQRNHLVESLQTWIPHTDYFIIDTRQASRAT